MAGSRPGERNGGAAGSTLMFAGRYKPLSDHAISFVRDYDIKAMAARLAQLSQCSFAQKMDTMRKNLEQFRKPYASEAFPNVFKAKDEGEEGEDSDVEDGDDKEEEGEERDVEYDDDKEEEGEESEVEDEYDGEDEDEETLKLQVPNEGEPECKKPRLAHQSEVAV